MEKPLFLSIVGVSISLIALFAVQTYSNLSRSCYWAAGDYRVRVKVKTSRPNKTFSFEYLFNLTEDDEKKLQTNCVAIMYQACELPATYNFANPAWRAVEKS